MADKEKRDTAGRGVQMDERTENHRAAGPGMMKIFLFVAMPLMLFQAGLAYWLVNKVLLDPAIHSSKRTAPTTSTDVDGGAQAARGQSAGVDSQGNYSLITWENQPADQENASGGGPFDDDKRYTYFVKDMIVNPAATAGTRFLNVTLAFEYGREGLHVELQEQDFRIRDALIGILISKRIDEIDGADDKERLRREILQTVNRLLTKGKIRKVYFTNFVMQ